MGGRRIVLVVTFLAIVYCTLTILGRGGETDSALNRAQNIPLRPVPEPELPSPIEAGSQWGHPAIKWDDIPQTKLLKHKPGFSIFDNIYMMNKTWFIVTEDPSAFPPVGEILNSGLPMTYSESERDPTDVDMQIISLRHAKQLFGHEGLHITGVSFSTNEADQFLNHYYHFVGETILGLWRLYTTLDMGITTSGRTSLKPISRWIFPHAFQGKWRDRARMNAFVIAAAFPSATVWGGEEWEDLADSGKASKFDRLVLTDRSCVERNTDYWKEGKFASIAFRFPGGPNWWVPLRQNVLSFVGMGEKDILNPSPKPVITYISRQTTGRRLLRDDHDRLVDALLKLQKDHDIEVHIPVMEKMRRGEQIALAAKTTIMMGVHGNGLTHLLWMHRNPKASVFEFYIPGGYAADYSWPAAALGLTHYGFWNNTYFTPPNVPERTQPDGFHGDKIPIDAETVVNLCKEILLKQ